MSVPVKRKKARSYLAADDRRDQLLDVAKRLFSRHGVRRIQVSDICEAAGVGRGTLYQYFDNKHAVLKGVIDAMCERMRVAIEARADISEVAGVADIPLALLVEANHARLESILNVVFADEAALRFTLREARGLDGAIDRAIAKLDALLIDAIEVDIQAAKKLGLVRKEIEPVLAARFILGGIEKMILSELSKEGPLDRKKLLSAIVDMEMFGLSARGAHA